MKRFIDGALLGVGFIMVVSAAFAIAWAGDVFTVDKDGTLKFAVNDQGKITVGATESYVNLVIQNNAAAANNKVDITADVLTVEGIRLENVNISADLTLSGAGGLDTGSEASGTWYYVWVLTNNDGIQRNGLFSTSSTSPTMPTGFTKKRRVGAVRNNGSSNFLQFVQEGNRVNYLSAVGANDILTNGTASSYTTVSAASVVPSTSRKAMIHHAILVRASAINIAFDSELRKTGSSGSQVQIQQLTQVANQTILEYGDFVVDLDSSQQLDYQINNPASATARNVTLTVYGYYDRI